MELSEDRIRLHDVERNAYDELAIGTTAVLERLEVDYAVVAGYLAILLGRTRATEDVDVIVEPLSADRATALATALREAGYWGSAMPLDDLHETLAAGTNVRVAEDGEVVPNVELNYAADEYDRASIANAVVVEIDGAAFRVGEPELQVAYKLRLGSDKDVEDATHLLEVLDPILDEATLERYVTELGVEAAYDRLAG
jgi:hypothetical protein